MIIKGKKLNSNDVKEDVKVFIRNQLQVEVEIEGAYVIKRGENDVTNIKLQTWEENYLY